MHACPRCRSPSSFATIASSTSPRSATKSETPSPRRRRERRGRARYDAATRLRHRFQRNTKTRRAHCAAMSRQSPAQRATAPCAVAGVRKQPVHELERELRRQRRQPRPPSRFGRTGDLNSTIPMIRGFYPASPAFASTLCPSQRTRTQQQLHHARARSASRPPARSVARRARRAAQVRDAEQHGAVSSIADGPITMTYHDDERSHPLDRRGAATFSQARGARVAQAVRLAAFRRGGAAGRAVHTGVTCDRSGMSPIVGPRFHLPGRDYDPARPRPRSTPPRARPRADRPPGGRPCARARPRGGRARLRPRRRCAPLDAGPLLELFAGLGGSRAARAP